MLEVRNVSIRRDDASLRYHFSLEAGKVMGVQGVSGVGKSTLLHLIAGFAAPDAGDIIWQKKSLLSVPVEKRPISFLFQDHNLFEHLTVIENLQLGFGKDVPRSEIRLACEELGVEDQLAKFPGQLSGGQRQRVAIIRTLLRTEPIVLLDEPFAELDAQTREVAASWSRGQITRSGKTVLLVTHQNEDIQQVTDVCLTLN
ncbi:MAG: ATP-binding cassette domain-containing protein [Hahellaceae bacterium]|nr:ATP-binding cassette domain-containing protein [Hahellaceae bacterium]MCP5212586.1 ATP-binding cassette domain-containing protein [Hahellaceae bacterium]